MKNKDKEEKISFAQAFKMNWRAFGIIYRKRPQMIASRLIASIWDVLTPYAEIWLSARIIDELAGDRDPWRLKFLVILTLAVTAASALISAFIRKWRDVQDTSFWFAVDRIFIEKKASLDYADLDNPKTHELIAAMETIGSYAGGGFARVVFCFDTFFQQIFSIAGGIALTVSLFTSKTGENAASALTETPWIAVVAACVMGALIAVSSVLNNKSGAIWAKNAKAHVLGNRLFWHFGWLGWDDEAAADIRIYNQQRFCGKYIANKESAFESKGLYAKLSKYPIGVYSALSTGLSVLFSAAVNAYICIKAVSGAFGVGMVTQYTASTMRVFSGIGMLIEFYGDIKNNAAYLKLDFQLIDMKSSLQKGTRKVEPPRKESGGIEFKNVSFKYPGTDDYVLKNVSIRFRPGSRLAAVGMNGSGKTTFIKLLCRLYDPTEGEILYNGVNIKEYDYSEYMRMFAVVFQDFYITKFKLGENVSSGPITDREKVEKCLESAGFADKLAEYEKGIDTYMGKIYDPDGVECSGGEAQKIAIARSLYKDAPFIILDEPTASLDPIAEADIYSKFNDSAKGKSAIYISHRLSSCKFCDEIAVFHEGQIIQHGSHDELLSEEDGKYRQLWYAQAQYYQK